MNVSSGAGLALRPIAIKKGYTHANNRLNHKDDKDKPNRPRGNRGFNEGWDKLERSDT